MVEGDVLVLLLHDEMVDDAEMNVDELVMTEYVPEVDTVSESGG